MNNEEIYEEDIFIGPEHSMYANEVKLMGGKNDAVLSFEFNSPRGIEEKVNIVITPSVLKSLGDAINSYIEYYEEKFYKLPDVELNSEKYEGHNSADER